MSTQQDIFLTKERLSYLQRKRRSLPQKINVDSVQILDKYNFLGLMNETKKKIDETLKHLDPLELLDDIEFVKYGLGTIELENRIMSDYLESQNPVLAADVRSMLQTKDESKYSPQSVESGSRGQPSPQSAESSSNSGSRSQPSVVSHSLSSSAKSKLITDRNLNSRTKAMLAERTLSAAKKRLLELEQSGTKELKNLRARYASLQAHNRDTMKLLENFKLHFHRDNEDEKFLEIASERRLQERFRKFTSDWFKIARTLMGMLNLAANSLSGAYEQNHISLVTKTDLSAMLCEADFELLPMQCIELRTVYKDRLRNLKGMHDVGSRTESWVARIVKQTNKLEAQIKFVDHRAIEIKQNIARIMKETDIVVQRNTIERQALQQMRQTQEDFEAPSVESYLELKEEANSLEKKEKMLLRKIGIARMKLKNCMQRSKQLRKMSSI